SARFCVSRQTIARWSVAGLALIAFGWGLGASFYSQKLKTIEQRLQPVEHKQLAPTEARAIISYRLTRDEQMVRGTDETPMVPQISLRLHALAISLELPLSPATPAEGYIVELRTFTDNHAVMTQNFLHPSLASNYSAVQIVVPADLLKPDTYYT